jgi:transcriptional regulator with XRE-family HTH domain
MLSAVLGKLLREARENSGLSQEDLAARARVHRTYISLLERDKKSPTLKVLLRICKALGVSAADVIAKLESRR